MVQKWVTRVQSIAHRLASRSAVCASLRYAAVGVQQLRVTQIWMCLCGFASESRQGGQL